MGIHLIFWLLVATTVVLMLAIFLVAFLFLKVLRNKYFGSNSVALPEKTKQPKTMSYEDLTLSVVGILVSTSLFGQSIQVPSFFEGINLTVLWILLFVDLILLVVFLYLVWILKKLVAGPEAKKASGLVSKITHALTNSTPIEREADIMLDHDYDGIHELDNNLPPWWKWMFYLTIFSGVLYMVKYHVLEMGDLQYVAYEKDMVQAQKEIKAYLKSQAMNIDETNVTLLTDGDALSKGQELFTRYCQVCHAKDGGGLVGPNLTDNYWIYGHDVKGIFKVIKYGAKNGMKSWKDELNPLEMQQLSSYIKSIKGTNPENPKPPQGKEVKD